MAKGFVTKRSGTGGTVIDVDNLKVLTTAQNLSTAKLSNGDGVTFSTNGTAASSIVAQDKNNLLESSIYGADALQRTKNRLNFLGNTTL